MAKVGKILEDGSLCFNDNLLVWNNSNLDSKCEKCRLFPLCGNRSCPYAKIRKLNSEDCETSEKVDTIIKLTKKGLI